MNLAVLTVKIKQYNRGLWDPFVYT